MFKDFYHGKKVLVLGHTGFKGAWLTQWLLSLGADVTGVSAYVPSEPAMVEVLNLKEQIKDYQVDIRDLDALLTIFSEAKPDVVFHLAAQSIVKTSYDNPKLTFDTNLGGTVNVMEAIRQTDSIQSAVLITSDKCYENVEWVYGYREDDRLGGKDPYSASKACAEIAFHAYYESFFKDSNVRVATVRAGNVIGGGDWAASRIVPDCMRAWSEKEAVQLRAPNATRPWQHVLEPLSGYLWLGACLTGNQGKSLSGESFNFGPDASVNHPVKTLIENLASHWPGAKWGIDTQTQAMKEAGLLKLSCDKALYHLQWQASMTFAETVEMTATWYRDYYQGADAKTLTQNQIKTYMQLATQRKQVWMSNSTQPSMASA
jgi:CDP-glucose 4,6-dehydratase